MITYITNDMVLEAKEQGASRKVIREMQKAMDDQERAIEFMAEVFVSEERKK